MKIEIEIDESLIPEGYEVVGFRVPKDEELVLQLIDGGRKGAACYDAVGLPCLILKKIRWRAEKGGEYWLTTNNSNLETGQLDVISDIELGVLGNERSYQLGNYYQTKEEAEQAAERVKKAYLNE